MFVRLLPVLFFPAAAFAQGVLPNDPLMRFTFDDTIGVGQVVLDESGSSLDAWSLVDPVYAPFAGALGEGLVLTGKTDHVVLPTDAIGAVADLESGSIFVRFGYSDLLAAQGVMPVVYVGQAAPADKLESLMIIEVGHGTGVDNHKLYFTWTLDGALALCFDTDFDLKAKKMYSFLGIVGPDGNTGWLNGKELTQRHYNVGDATTSYFFDDIPAESLQQFSIGQGKTLDNHTPEMVNLRGFVDEVQIFDRVLTAAEAAALTEPLP